ncbi:MAG: cohesin domain-containing protein [Demequina sp.]
MHSLTPPSRTRRTALCSGALALGVVLAGSAAYAVPSAGTPTIEAPATVDEGDSFTVTVALPASADAFAYSLALGFDAAVVDYIADSAVGPDGGFSATSTTADAVVFTHTRLGTSPGLAGDLLLVSADFAAIAGGSALFNLDSLTLVGADGEELVVAADVSIETEITPADDGTGDGDTPGDGTPGDGTPGDGDTPGDGTPADGTDDEPTDAVGDGVSVDGPNADGLSDTGASPAALIITAAIMLAVGITLVARKSVMSR